MPAFTSQIPEKGIYYISDRYFQIQLIIQRELDGEKNRWLKSLTNNLSGGQEAEKLLQAYQEHDHDTLYQSVMNVVMKANKKLFGGKENMCEALIEIAAPYFEKKIEESRQEGMIAGKQEGKKKSLLEIIDRLMSFKNFTLEDACEVADLTVEEYKRIKERMTLV